MSSFKILLSQGKCALVDDGDFQELSEYRWQAFLTNGNWYARRNACLTNGKKTTVYMHRRILGLKYGDKRQVDHINGNGLDNRRCNLRLCTISQNSGNRQVVRSRSGFKGVTRCSSKINPWQARIQINGRIFSMGCYEIPEEAAWAYDFGLLMLQGEFAGTNHSLGLL